MACDNCQVLEQVLASGITGSDIMRWDSWYVIEKIDNTSRNPVKSIIATADQYTDMHPDEIRNQIVAFSDAISSCRKSAAIVGEDELVDLKLFLKLRTSQTASVIGGTVGQQWGGVSFFYNGIDQIPIYGYNRLQNLFASGIYHIWKKWYDEQRPHVWRAALLEWDRSGNSTAIAGDGNPYSLTMESNIQTAFYLLGYGILASVVSLLAELGWDIINVIILKVFSYLNRQKKSIAQEESTCETPLQEQVCNAPGQSAKSVSVIEVQGTGNVVWVYERVCSGNSSMQQSDKEIPEPVIS
jgi:hypothetical protein